MYQFLDREPAALAPGHRFILTALRGWAAAAHAGLCPPRALAVPFARDGALDALTAFHLAALLLARHGLVGGTATAAPVNDEEAVALALWTGAAHDPEHAATALARLLPPACAATALRAMHHAAGELAAAGLPLTPAPAPRYPTKARSTR